MGTVFCWPSKTFDNSEDVDIALLHSIYENTSSSVCNTIQQHYKPSSRTFCKHVNSEIPYDIL